MNHHFTDTTLCGFCNYSRSAIDLYTLRNFKVCTCISHEVYKITNDLLILIKSTDAQYSQYSRYVEDILILREQLKQWQVRRD